MTRLNRKRLIRAGFSVFTMDTNTGSIFMCNTSGSWIRVSTHSTLKEALAAFAEIMRGPLAISD